MSEVDIRLLLLEQYEQALNRAWQKGDVEAALGAAQALVKVRKDTLGANHAEVANGLYEVAEALRQKRDLASASEALREALAIEEAQYGKTHERYGEALHRLGEVLLALKAFDEARTVLSQASRVLEAALGEADARVAMALVAEAAVQRMLGDLPLAAQLLERSLQVIAAAHGPENEHMAAPLEALASLQQVRGEWEDAIGLRSRVVRILERVKSPGLALALQQLAQVALDADELNVAEDAAARAVRLHASPTAQRAQALETLGEVLERRNRLVEAREQYRAALDLYERTLQGHHPQVGVASMNVATLELRLGEVERATELAEHSLRVFMDAFGPVHPHTRALGEALRRTFSGHKDAWASLEQIIQVPT